MFKIVRLLNFYLLCVAALLISSCGGQLDILSGLNENDANQVIVLLQSKDITASKISVPGRTVTYTIKVGSSDAQDALKLLVDNKLPKIKSAGLAEVYPVGGGGLIPSPGQEKAQMMMALQGEIENMLLVLPGIVQARAVIVLPDPSIIRERSTTAPQTTASIAVVYNPIDSKGTASVSTDDIKYLVASAVPELSPSAVTVLMASNVPVQFSSPKPAPSPTNTVATASLVDDRDDSLLLIFGGIAAGGLVLGVLALLRAIVLRSRLRRLERHASDAENI